MHPGYAALLTGAAEQLLDYRPKLETDASALVEIRHRAAEDGEWIGLFNLSGQKDGVMFEPVPMRDIRFTLDTRRPVREVRLLKAQESLAFSQDAAGRVSLTVPELCGYEVILFEYKP